MRRKNQTIGLIALSRLKGIGPAFIKKIATADLFSNSEIATEIESILSLSKKDIDKEEIYNGIENAKDILFRCKEDGIEIIPITDENYPLQLKAIKDPPPIIYCYGNLELLYRNTIGIIGTREPNENGIKISERVGQYFSANGWAICNGLAEGVDNYSIKTNEKVHSNVIGILAGGLNYNYKKTLLRKTAENAEQVLQNAGLLISEVPLDKKEDTFSVVKSCRIQAGISNGLLIVQSSLDGGSKYTTKAFCELPRPVAVINPIHGDIDLPSYNANKEIILASKDGLARFADTKLDKIQTDNIIIIKSKENYAEFEELMKKQFQNTYKQKSTLFD
ncbi:hypothetical protein GCM10023093_01800 [Nemorincola caseinilytica]|uniref:Smf/DprA SLOG domain-containing protein n=1 Tax=Nemorincola caseinilytica TaxID=2054315 RepID=A0ABP8N4Z9_9BACT